MKSVLRRCQLWRTIIQICLVSRFIIQVIFSWAKLQVIVNFGPILWPHTYWLKCKTSLYKIKTSLVVQDIFTNLWCVISETVTVVPTRRNRFAIRDMELCEFTCICVFCLDLWTLISVQLWNGAIFSDIFVIFAPFSRILLPWFYVFDVNVTFVSFADVKILHSSFNYYCSTCFHAINKKGKSVRDMGSEGAARSSAQSPEFPIGGSGGPKGVVVPCLSHALSVGSQMQHSQQVVVSSLSDLPQLMSEVVNRPALGLILLSLNWLWVGHLSCGFFLAAFGLWHFGSGIFLLSLAVIFCQLSLPFFWEGRREFIISYFMNKN